MKKGLYAGLNQKEKIFSRFRNFLEVSKKIFNQEENLRKFLNKTSWSRQNDNLEYLTIVWQPEQIFFPFPSWKISNLTTLRLITCYEKLIHLSEHMNVRYVEEYNNKNALRGNVLTTQDCNSKFVKSVKSDWSKARKISTFVFVSKNITNLQTNLNINDTYI